MRIPGLLAPLLNLGLTAAAIGADKNGVAPLAISLPAGPGSIPSRDGRQLLLGQSAAAGVEDAGRVFEWCLDGLSDKNGNAIDYEYLPDPTDPAQKHPRRIRWGQPEAYFAAVLHYREGRPDVVSSFRPGFELKTSLRLSGIEFVSSIGTWIPTGFPATISTGASSSTRSDSGSSASARSPSNRSRSRMAILQDPREPPDG
jgi:hypothetical protein